MSEQANPPGFNMKVYSAQAALDYHKRSVAFTLQGKPDHETIKWMIAEEKRLEKALNAAKKKAGHK